MPLYQVGDTVRLSTTFLVGVTPTDPSTTTLQVTDPDAATSTYTYALAEITQDSPGVYHKDIACTIAGIWRWKWIGTGTAAGVDEGTFTVERSLLGRLALISVDEVKGETESTVTDDDDQIQQLVNAASRSVMSYTGREFVTASPPDTARLFDLPGYGGRVAIGDLTLLSEGDPNPIRTSDGFGGTATVIAATDYALTPRVRMPGEPFTALIVPTTYPLPSAGVLSVTGTWGWPYVPEDVRHATSLIVREWLSKSSSEWGMPDGFDVRGVAPSPTRFAMPFSAKQILDRYRWIAIGFS